jgi:hypothetical protein
MDTIELLEAIGRDASLRHAPAADLAEVLERAQASDALKAAVALGDSMQLARELGHKPMEPPQIIMGPAHEDEPDQDDDGDGDGDGETPQPPSPGARPA